MGQNGQLKCPLGFLVYIWHGECFLSWEFTSYLFYWHFMRYALTCPGLWLSGWARVYQALYFDCTANLFTVCIQGLGTTVNISSSLCKPPQLWANLYRHSMFEWICVFSRNKSDKKDKLSHQSFCFLGGGEFTSYLFYWQLFLITFFCGVSHVSISTNSTLWLVCCRSCGFEVLI